MNQENVNAVFEEAILVEPADRAAFVAMACAGDEDTLTEVMSLLQAFEAAGDFLAGSLWAGEHAVADPQGSAPALLGSTIGPFKLIELIGEGGFGSVYMAQQVTPIRRLVAVKILKPGMDSRQVIGRFEAERQALAMMDHPNIAKVLDAGSTESGRLYFVMEYIKGVPILEFCDANRLNTKARLELFTSVCNAIQHAHQKGIIHRDIKPSNVLVTIHDGVPVTKVIDFGIAKATGGDVIGKTSFTEHRQMIGTPAYMSPEQAEMSGLDVDTRSDIYSLGVLLYQLLTGTTPFAHEELMSRGFAEMMRIIREVEPHKPSTRLSLLGEIGTHTAQQRLAGDARQLCMMLQGDLDWIVMKCLEKDRTRRYETATGLAADIQRHLSDEPVTAGPPSTGYRFRKFVKRHRLQVMAAGVVVGVLLLGIAGTSTGLVWAIAERGKARTAAQAEETAKLAAQAEERQAIAQAKRAQIVTEFVITALKSGDAWNEGGTSDATILSATDNAVKDIQAGRFKDDPVVEASLKNTIATILLHNGREADAQLLFLQALETRRRLLTGDHNDLAASLTNLATALWLRGRATEAEPLSREALEMHQRLFPGDHPGTAKCLDNLGKVLISLGRPQEAEPLLAESVRMRRRVYAGDDHDLAMGLCNLASAWQALGRLDEAESLCAEAVDMETRLVKGDHPELASALRTLAGERQARGRLAEAESLIAQSIEIDKRLFKGDSPGLAGSLEKLAGVRNELGHYSECESILIESLEMRRRLFKGDHPAVALSLNNLAGALHGQKRLADAERLYGEALDMYNRLAVGDHPFVASTLHNLADIKLNTERGQEAEDFAIRALEMFRRLHRDDDANVAREMQNVAKIRQLLGRPAEAEPLFLQSLEMYRRLHKYDHADVAQALAKLAGASRALGRLADAEDLYTQSLEMYRRLHAGDHVDVARALNSLADVRRQLGHEQEAESLFEQAKEMRQRVFKGRDPAVLITKSNLAAKYWSEGNLERSIPLFEELLAAQEEQFGRESYDTALTVANLGVNYVDAGRFIEGLPLLEEAYQASKRYPNLADFGPSLLASYAKHVDPAKPADLAKVVTLAQELVAKARSSLTEDSPELAGRLAHVGSSLLLVKQWNQAEPLIRECLAIREKIMPTDLRTLTAKSMLGAALMGQQEFAEAESLLLDAYRPLNEHEAELPSQARVRYEEVLERLARLYEVQGNDAEAATWRGKLEGARARHSKPPEGKK